MDIRTDSQIQKALSEEIPAPRGLVTFFCFDMCDGRIAWKYDSNGLTPFMIFNTLYAASINAIILVVGNNLTAFNAYYDIVRWQVPFEGGGFTGNPVYQYGIFSKIGRGKLTASFQAINGMQLRTETSSGIPGGRNTFRGDIATDR